MPDLTKFLLDRITEDKERAEEAQAVYDRNEAMPARLLGAYLDPARVLAECEAKRRIVTDEHFAYPKDPDPGDTITCASCSYGDGEGRPYPCNTLRILASVHAGHPDFDETWRVE